MGRTTLTLVLLLACGTNEAFSQGPPPPVGGGGSGSVSLGVTGAISDHEISDGFDVEGVYVEGTASFTATADPSLPSPGAIIVASISISNGFGTPTSASIAPLQINAGETLTWDMNVEEHTVNGAPPAGTTWYSDALIGRVMSVFPSFTDTLDESTVVKTFP